VPAGAVGFENGKDRSEAIIVSQIRWYHFYFLLALFDLVVIMFSLHLHNQTLKSVGQLIAAAKDLDEHSSWHQSAQQRILELNAPGNDLFGSEDYQHQQDRFRLAQRNMAETLAAAAKLDIDVALLRERIDKMVESANKVFDQFDAMRASHLTPEQRRERLVQAGRAMARMDDQQHLALRALAVLIVKNASQRYRLLQMHEAALATRLISERYFLAAVILILVGVLAFGRRLQQADRALKQEKQRVQEERRERLAAVGELCSSVAHGIRNPLAAIRSSADLTLELGSMDENSRQRLQDILDEGKRLGDRVSGLLSMARVNSEAFEAINLVTVVLSAARELDGEISRRGLSLEKEVDEPEIVVLGDRRQLEQVTIELLSNAMEHSKPDGTVRVTCRRQRAEDRVCVIVEDSGEGVADAVKSRIFDLFFTTKPSGTGIGLATVKRIARLHGGDVALTSSPLGGSRFCVSLPLAGRNHHAREERAIAGNGV